MHQLLQSSLVVVRPMNAASSQQMDACSTSSAIRVEELQRALELLHRDILYPFFEPVERLRVVNNRAMRASDIVDAIATASLRPSAD